MNEKLQQIFIELTLKAEQVSDGGGGDDGDGDGDGDGGDGDGDGGDDGDHNKMFCFVSYRKSTFKKASNGLLSITSITRSCVISSRLR